MGTKGSVHSRLLALVVLIYVGQCIVGMNWGLPSKAIDTHLFGTGPGWSGERIATLAAAAKRGDRAVGADVDVDPLDKTALGQAPIRLNATDADAAEIYLRYRLYTHQPDEMITMMALQRMKPSQLRFDPGLYQYGGLFIYPVGALIKAADIVGLLNAHASLSHYLDHPDEFARLYIVSRAYAAAWGVAALILVYGIGLRLGGPPAGLLAAGCFAVMPVVVCMSHEGKPHLPGAALMLLAVWTGLRCVDTARAAHSLRDGERQFTPRQWFLLMSAACGASIGMVLSSIPIAILIPTVASMVARRGGQGGGVIPAVLRYCAIGAGVSSVVYVLTNPYVLINLFANREVLSSNFGNSFAMYEVSRVFSGFIRVMELTVEGATLPVVLIGTVAFVWAAVRRQSDMISLAVPAGLLFVQFILIGAGKPAEYGRFGVFVNASLAIAAAVGVVRWDAWGRPSLRKGLVVILIGTSAFGGARYLQNFRIDATHCGSRVQLAQLLAESSRPVAVLAEPAPYGCPPLRFDDRPVWLVASVEDAGRQLPSQSWIMVHPVDEPEAGTCSQNESGEAFYFGSGDGWSPVSSISWANKPFCVHRSRTNGTDGD